MFVRRALHAILPAVANDPKIDYVISNFDVVVAKRLVVVLVTDKLEAKFARICQQAR